MTDLLKWELFNYCGLCYCFRYMFWTDWVQRPSDERAKIEMADMDGSHRRNLVTRNIQWPNGLSVDEPANRLYWCDAYTDMIEYYDLDTDTRCVSAGCVCCRTLCG